MEDVKVKVVVETQESEQNVDNLNRKLDQTQEKAQQVNTTTQSGVSSVGNWGNAFENAFKVIDKGASQAGGNFGRVISSVKNAIPIVKNLNSTAIAGLKGIKAGIASTGIGLLLIALTEIVAHWKDIANWIGISTDKQNDYKKAVEASNQAVKDLSNELDYQRRLQQAAGADAVTIAKQRVEDEKKLGEELNKQYLQRVKEGNYSRAQIKKMQEELDKEMAIRNEALKKAQQELTIAETKAATEARNKQLTEAQAAAAKAKAKAEKDAADALKSQQTVYGAIAAAIKNTPELKDFWENLVSPNVDYLPAANLLQRFKEANINITEELVKDAINGNSVRLKNQEAFLQERIKRVSIAADQERQLEENKGLSLWHTEEDRAQKLLEITQREQKDIYEIESEAWDLRIRLAEDSLKAAVQFGGSPDLINTLKASLDLLLEQYENFEREHDIIFNKLEGNFQEYLDAAQDALNLQLTQTLDKSKLTWRDYVDSVSDIGREIGSIFDSMVDAEKNQIEMDQKLGKISEEQAKERFQQLKKYELAANWINTLSGIAKIFASPTEALGPIGWAINAAQAAALLAAGIARDKQIRNSYIDGGTGAGGSGTSALAGATPLDVMNDITPSATVSTVANPEDARVYILESDIQKSNNRVRIREAQTSW